MAAFVVSSFKEDDFSTNISTASGSTGANVTNSLLNSDIINRIITNINNTSSYNSSTINIPPSSTAAAAATVSMAAAASSSSSATSNPDHILRPTATFRSLSSSIPFGVTSDLQEKEINNLIRSSSSSTSQKSSSAPTVANMIFELSKSANMGRMARNGKSSLATVTTSTANGDSLKEGVFDGGGGAAGGDSVTMNYTSFLSTSSGEQNFENNVPLGTRGPHSAPDESAIKKEPLSEFRKAMGLCLPRVYYTSVPSVLWISEWIFVILVAPVCTILVCDLVVLSIARKQRHRIVMALYQITLSAQATVVRKGTTPPQLWLNRSIPAKSRAMRAVFEDFIALMLIHLPLILILVSFQKNYQINLTHFKFYMYNTDSFENIHFHDIA